MTTFADLLLRQFAAFHMLHKPVPKPQLPRPPLTGVPDFRSY